MGSRRVGLARTQALIQQLKRELQMGGSTFTNVNVEGTSTATYGTGAVSGSTTPPTTRVTKVNGEIITTITLDLTYLSSSAGNGKIVGNKEAAADTDAPAFLIQWDTTTNGVCYKVEMGCVELPAGNGTFLDFNLETDDVGTLEMGGDPRTNNVTILDAGGNFAAGTTKQNLVVGALANDQYIYLVNGAAPGNTGDAQYSAGQFVIQFHGYPTF